MKSVTANIQIQFDTFSNDIKEEVIKSLDEMSKVLGEQFPNISPVIFTNSIDDSDFEFDEEIDATQGVETSFGNISINHAVIDTDGTNLADGVEIRLDGELVETVIGGSTSFDCLEDLEEFLENNTHI